jgi:UDP-N-acetylglucosamine--N-acetylmuramyl-(pentapeptide) pyrophosphoryl-undecaprenol N-acetylglucosamine transferase
MNQPSKKIILTGGGSGGPVFPLLAVAKELKKLDPGVEILFVGTNKGPEQKMVTAAGLKFAGIPAAKFRRYFSLANITDFFVFLYSLLKARKIVKEFNPDVIVGAGGYVALPVSWMGWMSGIKIALHQQDAKIGLTNRMISPLADLITTAFERTSKDFYSGSGLGKQPLKATAEWVGNPVRPEFFAPPSITAKEKFGLDDSLPILLIVGGATGSTQINEVVTISLPELLNSHQVIHITGPGKDIQVPFKDKHYHKYEFLNEDMPDALKIADVVIARAGLSTIAELSVLGKIAIIVPMPDTHQEFNAEILKDRAAAVVLNKEEFNAEDLPRIVNSLKFNVGRQKLLSENIKKIMPHDAAQKMAKLILEHAK